METLFVYGTLKNERIQKNIIGRAVQGIPDVLMGYKIKTVTIEGEKFPILVKDKGLVTGLVLRLTSEELRKVDKYETNAYRGARETSKSGKNVWVYVKAIEKFK